MAKKAKVISTSMSFDGFDYKKLLLSMEKPLVGLATAVIVDLQIQAPHYSAAIGIVGTLVYASIKYFVKEYSA